MTNIAVQQSPSPASPEFEPLRADPEVPERARRRHFSARQKLRILHEADGCSSTSGAIGALLRREGIYSSHLTTWRRQREQGALEALQPRRRGRPPGDPAAAELARLRH